MSKCRNIESIPFFKPMDIMGDWYTQYVSEHNPWTKLDSCPIQQMTPRSIDTSRLLLRDLDTSEYFGFDLKISGKGNIMGLWHPMWYKGWFQTDSNAGTVWSGAIQRPIPAFSGNFKIVYLDDNLTIIYSCMEKFNPNIITKEYDNITILSRKPKITDEEEKILEEQVVKLFGPTMLKDLDKMTHGSECEPYGF